MSAASVRPKSFRLFKESTRYLVGGVNSPVRSFRSVGGRPILFREAKGAYLTDVDRNRYVDFCLSWGAIILGHADPRTCEAAERQLRRGSTFGTATPYELDLAKDLSRAFPHAARWRFTSSGTEAAMTAIRLARAHTDRPMILKFNGCYHGHSDSFLIRAGSGLATLGIPSSRGVPKSLAAQTLSLPYNDSKAMNRAFVKWGSQIACVILEPIAGNMGVIPAGADFVRNLKALTRQYGALLIFDEVITGFRATASGAQSLLGVTPDLTLLGKIIGGGMPVGALGGPARLMKNLAPEGSVYQAGTLSGNPLSMTAGHHVLSRLRQPGIRASLDAQAAELAQGFREWASKTGTPCQVSATGSLLGLFFQEKAPRNIEEITDAHVRRYKAFFWHMIRNGMYFPPSAYEAFFVSTAHGDKEIELTLSALKGFRFPKIKPDHAHGHLS